MFINSVVLEFAKFALFYIVLKALIQLVNLEARRYGSKTLAGVAGLFA